MAKIDERIAALEVSCAHNHECDNLILSKLEAMEMRSDERYDKIIARMDEKFDTLNERAHTNNVTFVKKSSLKWIVSIYTPLLLAAVSAVGTLFWKFHALAIEVASKIK